MNARKAEVPTTFSIVMARLRTQHFDFEAFGSTRVECEEAMKGALLKHADDYEIEPTWYLPYLDAIDYRILQVGAAFRDGELIYER